MKKGKIIVIEGTDGSGKNTQAKLLLSSLQEQGKNVRMVSFPNYGTPGCGLVEMYLDGQFGTDADAVNPYAASTFYAVDRFASFQTDWGKFYNNGGILVMDRYVSSNMLFQAEKLCGDDRTAFLEWLFDLEHDKMSLPKPDLTIYLHIPAEVTATMMRKRESETKTKADIHEKDTAYLKRCEANGLDLAEKYGWNVIEGYESGRLLTIEEVHEKIMSSIEGGEF